MEKITNIKVWDAIDERIDRVVEQSREREEALENRIKELENHNINNIIKRVEMLDNKIDDLKKYTFNNKDIKHLMDKIEDNKEDINHLEDKIDNYEHDINLPKIINDLHKKIDKNDKYNKFLIGGVAREIPDINQDTDITDKLNDRCDDLEAKNYQLKANLDDLANSYYEIINNINLNEEGK